jgi:trk system potassium uptake protein TrkH
MNLRIDVYILGWILMLVAAFQLLPLAAALTFKEPPLPFCLSAAIAVLSGFACVTLTRSRDRQVRTRDGFLIVGFGWLAASLFGALPYLFSGRLGPVDALFESVSGFTTTGSTVVVSLEGWPHGLLLWRSLTQWLGGMGIILFTIAVLPLIGIGGMQLFRAEVPGPVKDKIRPRLAETARQLWLIYVGLTVAECLLLVSAGLSPFEAICHSLTTLATGGFSTNDLSVGGIGSPLVQWIVTAFMLIAGMNFVLHYRILSGRLREVSRDGELRYFLGVVLVASVMVIAALLNGGRGFEESLRLGTFQVVSILTTTGYVTADFEQWAPVTHLVFLVLMVLGGMSGSTGGGVKSLRALLGLRALRASFSRILHRHAVVSVKYAGKPVSEDVLAGIWAFFTAYFLIAAAAALVVATAGYDLETAFSASLSAIGNIGPGLGAIGAHDNFAHFPALVKLTLAFCMIAGRLEVFTLLILFFPRFWRT